MRRGGRPVLITAGVAAALVFVVGGGCGSGDDAAPVGPAWAPSFAILASPPAAAGSVPFRPIPRQIRDAPRFWVARSAEGRQVVVTVLGDGPGLCVGAPRGATYGSSCGVPGPVAPSAVALGEPRGDEAGVVMVVSDDVRAVLIGGITHVPQGNVVTGTVRRGDSDVVLRGGRGEVTLSFARSVGVRG